MAFALLDKIKAKFKGKKSTQDALDKAKDGANKALDVAAEKAGVSADMAAKGKAAVGTEIDKVKADLA